MKIPALESKEFVIKIEWVVDIEDLLSEGTESVLDRLRENGSAEIIDIQLRNKK